MKKATLFVLLQFTFTLVFAFLLESILYVLKSGFGYGLFGGSKTVADAISEAFKKFPDKPAEFFTELLYSTKFQMLAATGTVAAGGVTFKDNIDSYLNKKIKSNFQELYDTCNYDYDKTKILNQYNYILSKHSYGDTGVRQRSERLLANISDFFKINFSNMFDDYNGDFARMRQILELRSPPNGGSESAVKNAQYIELY